MLAEDLFAAPRRDFTSAILNPPYRKIHSDSTARQRLREIGIETSSLYTAFLALAVRPRRRPGRTRHTTMIRTTMTSAWSTSAGACGSPSSASRATGRQARESLYWNSLRNSG